jgi:hypothetical protein
MVFIILFFIFLKGGGAWLISQVPNPVNFASDAYALKKHFVINKLSFVNPLYAITHMLKYKVQQNVFSIL